MAAFFAASQLFAVLLAGLKIIALMLGILCMLKN